MHNVQYQYYEVDRKDCDALEDLLHSLPCESQHRTIARKRSRLINDIARDLERLNQNEKAVYWFKRAAKLGDPEAQFNLAMMYATGKGAQRNYVQAYAWFKLAAENNYQNANASLGFASARLTVQQKRKADKLARHYKSLYFRSAVQH